jgi:hypothetical protein
VNVNVIKMDHGTWESAYKGRPENNGQDPPIRCHKGDADRKKKTWIHTHNKH